MTKIFFSLLLLPASCAYIHAQQQMVMNVSGSTATIDGITYEYSIGEAITTTVEAPGIFITQGFLQPGSAFERTGNVLPVISDLEVFPNPASEEIFLQPSFATPGRLVYRLYDMTGRLLSEEQINLDEGNERQSVSLRRYAAGQYMLGVQWTPAKGRVINTSFKIQKVQ